MKILTLSKLIIPFLLWIISTNCLKAQEQIAKNSNTLQSIQSDNSNHTFTLWGFGANYKGQLGDGTTTKKPKPVQIDDDYNWVSLSCATYTTMAVKNDGTLWACGYNCNGLFMNKEIESSLILKQIGNDKNWKFISNSADRALGVKSDGSLWAWGNNQQGTIGDSNQNLGICINPIRIGKDWNDVIFVSVAAHSGAAIRKGGTLYIWGNGCLVGNGTVYNTRNPVQIGNSNEWQSVYCGDIQTYAIKKDGTLWGWGDNSTGILGDESEVIFKTTPFQIGTDNNWVSVSITNDHCLALKTDGSLWAWGNNNGYSLGDSTIRNTNTPTQIGNDNDWISIATSDYCSAGIKEDGTLWQWGSQAIDEVYNISMKVPTLVKNTKGVKFVDIGDANTMYLKCHLSKLPTISTLPITNITISTAQSGGNITSDGGDAYVTRGICYSTSPEPTLKDNITEDGRGPGEYPSQLKNLKLFETYYVRAWATNEKGTSYGQEETFKVNLQKPKLISPDSGKVEVALNTSVTWNKVDSALKYRVQIATNLAFDAPLVDEETINLTYNYDKYENSTVYYWRVQALHDVETSDWSEVWEFTTLKFNPQVLLSPSEDTINVPIDCKLIWKQNSANTTYILQVSKFQNFSQKVIDIDLADTTYQSTVLEYLTSYYWRVRADNGDDQSDWSPIWKFTTLMDSVNLTSPIDLSKNINIPTALVWQEGIYKKDYRLQISEADDFGTTNTDTLISKFANADVKNLNYWQKYFWRVRNESGDTLGYWSEIWQFKTRMSDMLLMYPENTQTGLEQEINFKWYPVIGAGYYQLQISKNEQFTNMVYSKDSITTTEHFVPSLEKDILYYWRVRVWNTESIGTAYWSEVWTFRTGETSVKDEAEVIQIIPNPAGDFITITFELSGGTQIQIYNTLGEKVMTELIHPMTASHRMNIESLPKGIYFVKIGSETAKFVKL
jgi:alpha-tubulin suppressor-like RCC1 family protein